MAQRFTFPQSGDADDAEHFASMIGADNRSDYVEQGMSFTVDYTVPEVTVSTGKAFISQASATASSSGDSILTPNYVVQTDEQTVSLTDNAVNEIYVDPQFNTDDSGVIVASTSSLTGDELKIGEVDTSADTSSTTNREPDARLGSLDVVSGDITDGTNVIYDQSNNWVPQARLENDSVTVTAGDGLKGGGTVSLGGSTTVNIEPDDFAGTFLSDDGSDNLTVGVGFGLEGDGSGNIRVNEDADFTFTSAIDFSAGLDTQGDITDGSQVIWDASAQEIPDSAMGTINNSTLANSSITINGADGLSAGTVSLGGSVTVGIGGALDLAGDLLATDGEVIWDESNTYIPQGRLQNDSITVTAGDSLTGGGTVALGGSTTIDLGTVENSHLQNDSITVNGTDGLSGGTASLGGSLSVGIGSNLILGGNSITEVGGTTDASVGAIRLSHGSNIAWRGAADSADVFITVDGNNDITIGGGTAVDLNMDGRSIGNIGGSDAATFGALRLANNEEIAWRNSASNGGFFITFDTNDELIFGNDSISMDPSTDSFKMNGGSILELGDIQDNNNNTVYDFSNSWVPQARVEQGSGSGLDADTVDGLEASTLDEQPRDWINDDWFEYNRIRTLDGASQTITGSSSINLQGNGTVELDVNSGVSHVKWDQTNSASLKQLDFNEVRMFEAGMDISAIGADFYITTGEVSNGEQGFGFKITGDGASTASDVEIYAVTHDGTSETTDLINTGDNLDLFSTRDWRAELSAGVVEFYIDDDNKTSLSMPTGSTSQDTVFELYLSKSDSSTVTVNLAEYNFAYSGSP